MDVQIHQQPGTHLYNIWITQQGPGQCARWFLGEDGYWCTEEVDVNARVEPSLTLPAQLLSALVAEGSNVLPPDRAQARHLDDAIGVRDRLLDLFLESRRAPGDAEL